MNKKHLQPLIPAALYARVSSDRQDVDLSVSARPIPHFQPITGSRESWSRRNRGAS